MQHPLAWPPAALVWPWGWRLHIAQYTTPTGRYAMIFLLPVVLLARAYRVSLLCRATRTTRKRFGSELKVQLHSSLPGIFTMLSAVGHTCGQEAETKAKLKHEMESRYLNPETEEYKRFRAKVDAKREKETHQKDRKAPPARRPVKRETQADVRRMRLENRRVKAGRLPDAGGFD